VASVDVAHRARRAVHPELRGPIGEVRHTAPWSARCPRPARTEPLTQAAFLARREAYSGGGPATGRACYAILVASIGRSS
jgi:hypothetical protein